MSTKQTICADMSLELETAAQRLLVVATQLRQWKEAHPGEEATQGMLRELMNRLDRRQGEPPRALTIKRYAEAYGISEATVRRHIKDGVLPSTRLGRRVLIPVGQP